MVNRKAPTYEVLPGVRVRFYYCGSRIPQGFTLTFTGEYGFGGCFAEAARRAFNRMTGSK